MSDQVALVCPRCGPHAVSDEDGACTACGTVLVRFDQETVEGLERLGRLVGRGDAVTQAAGLVSRQQGRETCEKVMAAMRTIAGAAKP